jgi:hypothetical protein
VSASEKPLSVAIDGVRKLDRDIMVRTALPCARRSSVKISAGDFAYYTNTKLGLLRSFYIQFPVLPIPTAEAFDLCHVSRMTIYRLIRLVSRSGIMPSDLTR